ncbi:MAG: hypothetical protein ACI85O_002961 [Saprospiraceae bacterium]|jgi:hypothetical protein
MNSTQTERGLWEWKLVKVILTASILFFAGNFLHFGYTEGAVRQCIALVCADRCDTFYAGIWCNGNTPMFS